MQTPLSIHSKFPVDDAFRAYVREHLDRALEAHTGRIDRITVHFEDNNGTRGGEDTVCAVHVALSHDEPVVIREIGADAKVAFDLAIHRVVRNVQRHVERHRKNRRDGDIKH